MKKFISILSLSIILFITGCSATVNTTQREDVYKIAWHKISP